jgi:hypothetical protein
MKPFLALITALATCALAIQDAPAARAIAKTAAASSTSPASASSETSDPATARVHFRRGPSRKNRSSPASTPATRIVVERPSRSDLAAARKAALQEKAEAGARADRLYGASQLSAPIIVNAKACKRIGANGESIYENC